MENDMNVEHEELIKNLLSGTTKGSSDFILLSPLYKTYKVNNDNDQKESFEIFMSSDAHYDDDEVFKDPLIFDTYCPQCKKESTFKNLFTEKEKTTANFGIEYFEGHRKTYSVRSYDAPTMFVKEFVCSRDSSHVNVYVFLLSYDRPTLSVTKIGEYPSTLVAHTLDLKKYRKHFENYHDQLVMSLKAFSNGIGVGSFVYLRRIFEDLVWKAYARHKIKFDDITELEFRNKKMAAKIDYVKDELPEFLVEKDYLYSILSKAIHSLEESFCLKNYVFVKDSILLILDQEIERIEKNVNIKNLEKAINNINSNI